MPTIWSSELVPFVEPSSDDIPGAIWSDNSYRYVKFYQQSNVSITHLGFLNEPELTCV